MIAALLALPAGSEGASVRTWQPPAGHAQVNIWPGNPPGEPSDGKAETVTDESTAPVAGRSWQFIEHVSVPTITTYTPESQTATPAVLVFPGGGYQGLAIDLEGTEACDWLVSIRVACAVVKYRGPSPLGKPPYFRAYPNSAMALQDSQRALRWVRAHARDLNIDPHKVGVLGFSAGGHIVALLSVHFREQLYAPHDEIDLQSARPDFAIALYPGHLALWPPTLRLNPDIAKHITSDAPPTFLLQNEDDHVDNVNDSLSYYIALRRAEVPVEMHLFAHGGHAFGLRRTDKPATAWPQLVETWLGTLNVTPKQ